MEKFRKHLVVALAFLLLMGVMSLTGQHRSAAQQTGGLPALEKQVAVLAQRVADLQATNDSQASQITALKATNDSQSAHITVLQTALNTETSRAESAEAALQDRASFLEEKTQFLSADADAKTTTFTGCNVFIQDGSGATTSASGLGNLTIGYNELRSAFNDPDIRTGSHNLVLGSQNNYSSYGGLVAGQWNTISGPFSSVSGGGLSIASGAYSSVSGGIYNIASGRASSVSGGISNTQSSEYGWFGGSFHTP